MYSLCNNVGQISLILVRNERTMSQSALKMPGDFISNFSLLGTQLCLYSRNSMWIFYQCSTKTYFRNFQCSGSCKKLLALSPDVYLYTERNVKTTNLWHKRDTSHDQPSTGPEQWRPALVVTLASPLWHPAHWHNNQCCSWGHQGRLRWWIVGSRCGQDPLYDWSATHATCLLQVGAWWSQGSGWHWDIV